MLNNVTWFKQSAFLFNAETKRKIYIDPWDVPNTYPIADLIFITHAHFDHFDIGTIKQLSSDHTLIICPKDVAEELDANFKVISVKPGDRINPENIVKVEVVPAYNIDKPFHPKENNWVGYIFEINGKRYYHAGDTDRIPEMRDIRCDIAMLPIGGIYTMNIEEAVTAASDIGPQIAVPMHYGFEVGKHDDGEKFKKLSKIPVELLQPIRPFEK